MAVSTARSESLDAIAQTLTAGSVIRSVWQLAAPNLTTMSLTSLNQFMDAFFVGHLGKMELAANGTARQVSMLVFLFVTAITTGSTALVSRFTGARDSQNAVRAAQQSLRLSLVLSIIVGIPLFLFRRQILISLGAEDRVAAIGSQYLAITFATTTVLFLNMTLTSIFRGMGKMNTLVIALLTMDSANIALDYALIYGIPGLIPSMGVPGGALAAALSRLIPVVWLLIDMSKTEMVGALKGNWFQCDPEWVRRISRIGSPQVIGSLAFTLGRFGAIRLLNLMTNGTAAIAAMSFGLSCEALSFMPGLAFNMATATLVGQNLGAHRPERAARCARMCMWMACGFMGVVGLITFLFADRIAMLSGKDPAVIELCTSYLRVGALAQPFLGIAMALWGLLQGAGDTRYAAAVSMLSNFLLRIPLIWFFGIVLHHGVIAAWWSLTLSWPVASALLEYRYRSGKWKQIAL